MTTILSEVKAPEGKDRLGNVSLGIRIGWTVVCVVLAYLRLTGVMDNRFQAFAHLVVGALLGAWAFGHIVQRRHHIRVSPGFYGWLALLTSLVELYAFLAGIGKMDGQ